MKVQPDPHVCYAVSFALAVMVYMLGWSELYPTLTLSLLLFLVATLATHGLLSFFVRRRINANFPSPEPEQRAPVYITLFIYLLWVIEFIYEGGIPLLKILLDIPYNYRQFGVPTLHVFVVTFSSFYTVYLLHLYLSRRSKVLLPLYFINLTAAVLIYSRAMLFFNLFASLILYLNLRSEFKFRHIAVAGVTLLVLLYLFGVLGSLRVSRIAGTQYSNEHFLVSGSATEAFTKSSIPKEYFWTYIYLSSPLANLQQNIRLTTPRELSVQNIGELVNEEIFPDFISKRIIRVLDLHPPVDSRIPGPFNVSTIYSQSYTYAGWTGMAIIAVFLLIFPIVFTKILPAGSPFFLCGWSILCTMYFFSVYDNTFSFTGLSFQLAYPMVLHWLSKKLRRPLRVF